MAKIVLSLDGGGIRGAATAQFLKRLEADLGRSVYEACDLFAGTSTGGIIAVLLGCRKMKADAIADVYSYTNSNKIMNKSRWDKLLGMVQTQPIYDGKGKTAVLKKFCGQSLLENAKKPTLVAAYDVVNRKSKILKSTKKEKIPAYLAADASSAAPTYFPTVAVGKNWLIDGGVVANNPAMCAYAEALNLWGKEEEIKVISVGTGFRTRKIDGKKSRGFGALEWMRHDLLGVTMDESVVEYQLWQLLGDEHYIRVNSDLTKATGVNDEMDDCTQENIDNLKKLGDSWYEEFGERTLAFLISQ